ncbi:hypothetical protein M2412_002787, partial [Stenotrophomonas rhizophila]|nr:hypothetical protein [Stenotrophomonas rhizophila]
GGGVGGTVAPLPSGARYPALAAGVWVVTAGPPPPPPPATPAHGLATAALASVLILCVAVARAPARFDCNGCPGPPQRL